MCLFHRLHGGTLIVTILNMWLGPVARGAGMEKRAWGWRRGASAAVDARAF